MKFLITGGAGFIGSNLIHHLLSKHNNIHITNLDKLSIGSNLENLKDLQKEKRYKFINGDITNKDLLSKLINETDFVVNMAAESHVDRSISDPWPFINSNILGAVTLFEIANKFNKRILHISTDEIYGDIPTGTCTENSGINPSSPYSSSKASADIFGLAYHRTYGLNITIVRCTNNFGPNQFLEKLIPKTIIRASRDLSVPIYGKGTNIRDWIYTLDFCDAIDKLIIKGKSGEIYNVSADNELSNIDVVKMILKIMNKPESIISFVENRPGHDIRYSLDSSKIKKEFGWKPKYDFKDGLEKTINWYHDNEWWWKPQATDRILHSTPWKLKW